MVYLAFLIYFLFFSEEYGRVAVAEDRAYRYNLVPFVEIRRFWTYREQLGAVAFLTNIVGNVLAFIPYGFILPVIFRRLRNGFLVILSGFCVSLCVEVIQLVAKVGSFDVDDLLLNTVGVAAGYLVFFICNQLRRKYNG